MDAPDGVTSGAELKADSASTLTERRPRLLDLYCCAGGAGMGYRRAGFEVVGVDIDPQPNYPFEFVQADALEYLAEHGHEFDVIHGSPPCQGYLNLGAVNRALGRTYEHDKLIAATRELMIATGKPYVIENVADARPELIDPVRICGTGLGQPIRRHRLFESNVPLFGIACDHKRYTEPRYWTSWRPKGEHRLSTVVQIYGNAGGREHWPAALGIDWMTAKEMTECVPPSYTEHLGRQLMAGLEPALASAWYRRLLDTKVNVHNHPPYRPVCNERTIDGQLRGACLDDDGADCREPLPCYIHGGEWTSRRDGGSDRG